MDGNHQTNEHGIDYGKQSQSGRERGFHGNNA